MNLLAALLSIVALGHTAAEAMDRNRIDVSLLDTKTLFSKHRSTDDARLSKRPYRASPDGSRGDSLIHNDLVQILKAEAGEFPTPIVRTDDEWFPVETTYLRTSSRYHVDHKLIHGPGGPDACNNPIADDMVGFVALEDNKDAYFEHATMSVPIRAGTFIRFMGNSAHRTIINKGTVHLLGPVDIKSFIGVENSNCVEADGCCDEAQSPPTTDCLGGTIDDGDCIRCSFIDEDDYDECKPGCVYHQENTDVCMCISCDSTCGLVDAANNEGKVNKKIPVAGFPDGDDSNCRAGDWTDGSVGGDKFQCQYPELV